MKKLLYTVLVIMIAFAVASCRKNEPPQQAGAAPKLKVIATVYPVYEFVRQVGGDKVEVSMLVPAGAEPHDWEPTAKDLISIRNAAVVFFHGAGLESWSGKLLTKENLGSTQAVEVSRGIPVLKPEAAEAFGHAHAGHSHDAEIDPHIWLDPVLAQQEIRNIADALTAADAANKDYYKANADRYNAELNALHEEFLTALAQVKRREFVTNHAAFGYLAARYNLAQLPIMGVVPDAEPTPEKMAKIVKEIRAQQIKYVFSETVVSAKLAETIARETGARVLVLHPVDQLTEAEIKNGHNYLSIMHTNLINLKKALTE